MRCRIVVTPDAGSGIQALPDLLGRFAAPSGDANTPDTVDGFWWLAQPKEQQMWELGLPRTRRGEEAYERVLRDITKAAAILSNRMAQTGVHVPFTIKRKKTAATRELFAGGTLRRIGPIRLRK